MNPAIAHPDPLPLPAPVGLLRFLLLLTFFLHLVPMNLILGGSVIAAVSRVRGRRGAPHAMELYHWFTRFTPVLTAAAVSFGVAPLLFLQALYGRLFFSAAVTMGWLWLAVIPCLLLAYYGAYLLAYQHGTLGRGEGLISWGITACLVTIAFLYTNVMSLMLRPDAIHAKYLADGRGLHLNLDDPTVPFRFLHMALGSTAVAGMLVALLGLFRRRREPEFGAWAARHGALWFAIATAVNVAAGLGWLVTLPRETLLRFIGGNSFATAFLGAGVLLALVALVFGLLAVQSSRPAPMVLVAAGSLALALVAMILNRDQVRLAALETAGYPAVPWVVPQWGPMAIFAVLLVVAIVTVVWMVVLLSRGKATAR